MPIEKLISIIIPTYNRGYCLPRTIESVFEQTYQNFEIIIIDDGSTDGTEQIIQQRWPNEPRLRYLRQKNRGVSAARNLGIDSAKGDFIALLDSDDTWLPWKLEAQLACLRRFPSAVMVHSEMEAMDANGLIVDTQYLRTTYAGYQQFPIDELYSESCGFAEVLTPTPPTLKNARVWFGDIFSHMLTGNLMHTSTILIARAPDGSVEHYDETMRTEETYPFHLSLTKRGPIAFLDAASLRYQRGGTDHLWTPQVTYPPKMLYELNRRNLGLVEPHIKAGGKRIRVSQKILRRSLAGTHAWTAITAAGIGQYRAMLRHLFESLRRKPLQPLLLMRIAYYSLKRSRK